MRFILPIVGLFCFVLSACYEDVEGCLDPNAANYDLDADINCLDNCCEFPALNIFINHSYGDTVLFTDSFYVSAANDTFRISRLRYYWSDLALVEQSSNRLEPQDALDIGLVSTLGDTILTEINSNLNLFRAGSTQTRQIGTFRATENIRGIAGRIGITDSLQRVAPATAPNDHPLGFQEGRLHYGLDTGYVSFKLEYDLIIEGDTVSREAQAFGSLPFEVDFTDPVMLSRGASVTISFEAAVDDWLQNIDITLPEEELATQLRERIVDIFELTGIE